MFDEPPANLPVEPKMPAPPPPQAPRPVSPSAPPPMPNVPGTGKKEPEDIFAEIDRGESQAPEAPAAMMEAPKRSLAKPILLAVGVIVIVGAVGAAVWFFLIRPAPKPLGPSVPSPSAAPAVIPAEPEPVVEVPPVLPEPTPPSIPPPTPITLPEPEPVADASAVVPQDAPDSDADGLSDPEEALFGTNSADRDSDGDGFTDGSEVTNGYDPAASQTKLDASARFQRLALRDGVTALVPATWTSEGAAGSQFINTQTAANIQTSELDIADKPDEQTIEEWAASVYAVPADTLRALTTTGGFQAWQSADGLMTFVATDGRLLVIRYNVGTATSIEFRALYALLLNTLTFSS